VAVAQAALAASRLAFHWVAVDDERSVLEGTRRYDKQVTCQRPMPFPILASCNPPPAPRALRPRPTQILRHFKGRSRTQSTCSSRAACSRFHHAPRRAQVGAAQLEALHGLEQQVRAAATARSADAFVQEACGLVLLSFMRRPSPQALELAAVSARARERARAATASPFPTAHASSVLNV
jgi:hypothetical protein